MSSTSTTPTTPSIVLNPGAWRLDPERSSVEFEVRHLWGLAKVKGRFESYEGRLDLDAEPSIVLTIDAWSLQTGNAKRDQHLRSADFFDAEQHPYARFVSESITLGSETLTVRGRLHARDSSIPLDVEATIRDLGGEVEIEAMATAVHRELGMRWNALGMMRPTSRLIVRGRLVPAGDRRA